MSYKSTTSVPPARENDQREIDFDDSDGATQDIWTPANGKRVQVSDAIISVMNKHATGYIIVGIQIYVAGSWRFLLPVAVGPQRAVNLVHNFDGRVFSASGNGSSPMIRVARTGTSTSWEARGGITGEEV